MMSTEDKTVSKSLCTPYYFRLLLQAVLVFGILGIITNNHFKIDIDEFNPRF
jgi:hypothetical protein